jgi:putative transposase
MVVMLERETGRRIGSKRLRRLMREGNLQSTVRPKRFSEEVYVRRRKMKAALPQDHLKRNFFSIVPQRKLVSDITHLPCIEGMAYLNTIADLFNTEVLAYQYSVSIDTRLCMDTIDRLEGAMEVTEGVILHSDAGSTYMSYAYRSRLEQLGIIMSLGSRSDCYDNAAMESLNGVIKTECLYCRFGKSNILNHRVSREVILQAVVEFIEFFNNERPKERLGFVSPVEFRLQNPKGTYLVPLANKGPQPRANKGPQPRVDTNETQGDDGGNKDLQTKR